MGERVLVADDEQETLDAEAKLLEATGHTVVGRARNGDEACRMAESLCPDLILMDLKMPDMDGLEATSRIMEKRPVPVVLCTAYCDPDVLSRAAETGIYAYVNKPFRLKDLMCAIATARSRHADNVYFKSLVTRLEDEIETRKWVEKAKGILMKSRRLDEEQAHRYLQRESQRLSQPIGDLARMVVTAEHMFKTKVI